MPFKILRGITIFIIFHLSASAPRFIHGRNLEIKALPPWQQRYTFAWCGSLPLAEIMNVLIFVPDTQGRCRDWGQPGVIPAHVSHEGRVQSLWDEQGFQSAAAPMARHQAERVLSLSGFK